MNKKQTVISQKDDVLVISRKKHTNTTYLSSCSSFKYIPDKLLKPIDSCQNHIKIPADTQKKINQKYCTLVNTSNGKFIDVIIDDTPCIDNEIRITRFIERQLDASEGNTLDLCIQNSFTFNTIKLQSLKDIKNDVLALPDIPELKGLLEDFTLFEVINTLTNDSIFVRSKHILIDNTLKPNEIRINKKQRNMLSDNILTICSPSQWSEITSDKTIDQDVMQSIIQAYKKDGKSYVLNQPIDELDYSIRCAIQSYSNNHFGEKLIVRPVLESFHYEKKKSLYRLLSDLFIGKSTLSLNCRRPHECDENARVVRMSETNMRFLGIEPMDKVLIQFKENTSSCHVLPFETEKFGKTNVPSIIDLSIGIPAHIRNELKITDIQSSVKVDRDTTFIFKKNFNEQLVPIILTLLSLKFFENISLLTSVLLMLVLIPVVMFITLSPKRNMRSK